MMQTSRKQLMSFTGVGIAASLIHITTVFILVQYIHILPLVANILAFLAAFQFSYNGHRYLTFANLENSKSLSMPHFFVIAFGGALLNELLYFVLLHYTQLNYMLALCLVIGMVAIITFISSKLWACR